jgi:branched-chain amino acid transport system permease protein
LLENSLVNTHKRLMYPALLVFALGLPFILRGDYSQHILVMTCVFSILTISLDIIVGYMGQISLGHSAFFGVGAYTSALLSVKLGASVWLGWLAGFVLAGVLGLFVGYVSFRRTRGISLAIITFGFGLVLWLICTNWFKLTRGWGGLSGIPYPVLAIPGLIKVPFQSPFSYYYLVLAFLMLTVYSVNRLLRCRFGRAIVALRENEALARSIGIDALRHYVLGFALGTALAGLAGSAYAHFIGLITPSLLSLDYLFIMLIMLIVGGKGTIPGPIIGAAIFVLVPEWLRMTEEFRPILLGTVFLVVILFMPHGVYPALLSLWNRVARLQRR